MKAIAPISGFKGEAGFYTWIYRIVLNLHINKEKSLASRLDKKSYSMDNPGDEDRGALKDRLSSEANPDPSDEEIKEGLDGNLCRCTGYVKQITAVKKAAKRMREDK